MASIDEVLNRIASIESMLGNPTKAAHEEPLPPIKKTVLKEKALEQDKPVRRIILDENKDDEKTLENIKGIWTDVLSKVREKKMSTATYLAEGEPVSIKSNQLTIGIPAQFILHKEVLEDTGNRQLIETVLNALSGSNIKINFVITNTQSRSEDKEAGVTSTGKLEEVLTAEPMVKKALELFEGKVTKVVQ